MKSALNCANAIDIGGAEPYKDVVIVTAYLRRRYDVC